MRFWPQRTIRDVSVALVDKSRRGLARAVRDRIAGPDFESAHAKIWHSPGPRWFTEDDAIWEVHADTAMFIGGIRALLLQSLHPMAMLGVSEHSDFRNDPWGRLQRTSHYLATTTYGTIPDAERSIRIVRAIHKRVTGTAANGRSYRADDPHLLMWVHISEIDSFLTSHQTFGQRRLSAARADDYVRQSGLAAAKLGVMDPPRSVAELTQRIEDYRPELKLTEPAREAADLLLKHPPLGGPARLGYQVLATGAVSILPAWVRAQLLLPTLPASDRVIARPLARSALATIRWAMSDESVV